MLQSSIIYSPSQLDEIQSDLSPTLERGFDSYSHSALGMGWGLGFLMDFTLLRTAIYQVILLNLNPTTKYLLLLDSSSNLYMTSI